MVDGSVNIGLNTGGGGGGAAGASGNALNFGSSAGSYVVQPAIAAPPAIAARKARLLVLPGVSCAVLPVNSFKSFDRNY
jgi:hypothetical protein